MGIWHGVKYKEIFEYFEEISAIPRGSGNERAISDHLMGFAEKKGLKAFRDAALNVVIKKDATQGYEKAPTVIIQGHMDMVCEKNRGVLHDFEKDPIRLRREGDMIYAHDTTLGADDGIAIAYGMALLASKNIPHPAIEVLMTVDEEATMSGVHNLDVSFISGKLLINLDSEEEGKFIVSSAGGRKAKVVLPIAWEAASENMSSYYLRIDGLKGGHSGLDIEKGRGNANKLMGRLLSDIDESFGISIAAINGGMKSNVITRECEALVLVNEEELGSINKKLEEWNETFRNELRASDNGITVSMEKAEKEATNVFSKATGKKVIAMLMILPNGFQSMSMEIKGLVESSTNLGVVETKEEEVFFYNEIRSSVLSLKLNLFNQIKTIAEKFGGKVNVDSDYPEWSYNPDSELRSVCSKVYKRMYGKEAEVLMMHAGLECGVFMSKIRELDAISIAPNLFDVHTPNEHFSISSAERVWEFLLETLKEMKYMNCTK
ncbi:aminoacyl-histidine dipeptidase [Wukongibacter sp. M2B1]|uniref:aminoacyl-histidine dipeptidase n=1 Tax=Wukongibacter sp. M2B1 TaxID=3088895 RepID=UPI003D7B99C2